MLPGRKQQKRSAEVISAQSSYTATSRSAIPAVDIRLSLSLENTPLSVRFPMRICFSMNANISATHKTISTTPASPERKIFQERKLSTETA